MKPHNIKTLEINRGDNSYEAHFLLFTGDAEVPPTLKLELRKKNGNTSIISRLKKLLRMNGLGKIDYIFDRKDVDGVRGIIREYEGLYDGWMDSRGNPTDDDIE